MSSKFLIYPGMTTTAVEPRITRFPGGEVHVRIEQAIEFDEVRMRAILLNSDDIMVLVMLVDALREMGVRKIRLTMPYIPYARQDRVCNPGESLSMRAFAKVINSLGFSSIVVDDPHSDVAPALIERCIIVPRYRLMQRSKELMAVIEKSVAEDQPIYLVSPDAGAMKKSYEIMKQFPMFKGLILAEKLRDTMSGNIVKTVVRDLPDDVEKAHLIVCDDICDGGRTFIELAKAIDRPADKMTLFVSHGIFSQGLDVFEPYFDNVICSTNFRDYE